MKLYFIALSKHGDFIGANLKNALAKKSSVLEFDGVGGPKMGLGKVIPFEQLRDTIYANDKADKFSLTDAEIIQDIKKFEPDVLVTIGSWDFCSVLYEKLSKNKKLFNKLIKIHYVAPRIFYHNNKVAVTMGKYIDFLVSVYPQEVACFASYKLPAVYVGHPILEDDVVTKAINDVEMRKKYGFTKDTKILTAMLGSDEKGVKRMLPFFITAAKKVKSAVKDAACVMLVSSDVYGYVSETIKKNNSEIILFDEERDSDNILSMTDAAVASSEGASLRLSVAGIPHIVAYKEGLLSKLVFGKPKNLHFLNLTNDILEKKVIPVFLDDNFNDANINSVMMKLLEKGGLYQKQKEGFEDLRDILSNGKKKSSENASDAILSFIRSRMCIDGVNCIYF